MFCVKSQFIGGVKGVLSRCRGICWFFLNIPTKVKEIKLPLHITTQDYCFLPKDTGDGKKWGQMVVICRGVLLYIIIVVVAKIKAGSTNIRVLKLLSFVGGFNGSLFSSHLDFKSRECKMKGGSNIFIAFSPNSTTMLFNKLFTE